MQQKLNLTWVTCLQMGKNHRGKTPSNEFKVATSENPLLSKQAVTSKEISVPYTNLKVQLVYKTLWTFRPPNNKLPTQA